MTKQLFVSKNSQFGHLVPSTELQNLFISSNDSLLIGIENEINWIVSATGRD